MPDSNREMIDRYAKSESERLLMHEAYGKWEARLRSDIGKIVEDMCIWYYEAVNRQP